MYKITEQAQLTSIFAEDLSDIEREFIIGMAGASVTKTAQLASASIETVAKVTSAFCGTLEMVVRVMLH